MNLKKLPADEGVSLPPETKGEGCRALREIGFFCVLVILAFLVYGNILQAPFLFDDTVNITDNPNIRLTTLSLEAMGRAAFEAPTAYRPVAFLSFAFNYYLHQYNVAGYHLVNILIHITTAFLLYLLLKATLLTRPLRSRYGPLAGTVAFWASLLWLVHPLQTQSVTYVVQRMNSMAAMFYLLSMFCYLGARQATGQKKKYFLWGACFVAGLLALGSKEIAVTLPFFILLYEWYFFQDLDPAWLKRGLIPLGVVSVVLLLVFVVYLGGHPLDTILAGYGQRDFTLSQRVMTEFRVVFYYLGLLFFPHPSRLCLLHDFPVSTSLLTPLTTLFSLAGLGAMFLLACRMARQERLLSFALLWFLGNLVLESSVISLEIIFEHRNYLPSMFIIAAVVLLLCRFGHWRRLHLAMLAGLVLVCALWSHQRNTVWRDELTFWQDCVAKAPGEPRGYYALGAIMTKEGRLQEAIPYYLRAVQLKPSYSEAYNSLGVSLAMLGRYEEAVVRFQQALIPWPDNKSAHYNLGMALERLARFDEAVAHYREVIRIEPDEVKAHFRLGNALVGMGRDGEALQAYARVLQLQPDHPGAHSNMAVLRQRQKPAGL